MPSPSEENRRKYPEIAAVVDMFRAQFGEVHVICAADCRGNRVGKAPATQPDWFERFAPEEKW